MENSKQKTVNGLLLVDKPAGWTSHDVVAKVRSILKKEVGYKVKVGHTGTLDPFATGLLVLVVGSYTKKAGEFSKLDKTYEAEITLGATSSTGDIDGEILPFVPHHPPGRQSRPSDAALGTLRRPDLRSSLDVSQNTPPSGAQPVLASNSSTNGRHIPSEQEVRAVLSRFEGEIEQTPHAYSAVKVDGQRAYALARAGKKVQLEPRQVTIYNLHLTDYAYPKLKITARVSSGTYIRSLAEDVGEKLGTGAYLSALRRTSVGEYGVDEAKRVDIITISDIII